MFQADSDFYQYTAAAATDGDSATTWQPTTEQVIQEGELIFHAPDGGGEAEGGVMGESREEEERSGGVTDDEVTEDRETDRKN